MNRASFLTHQIFCVEAVLESPTSQNPYVRLSNWAAKKNSCVAYAKHIFLKKTSKLLMSKRSIKNKNARMFFHVPLQKLSKLMLLKMFNGRRQNAHAPQCYIYIYRSINSAMRVRDAVARCRTRFWSGVIKGGGVGGSHGMRRVRTSIIYTAYLCIYILI